MTYLNTLEFAETLLRIQGFFPEDKLEIKNWKELWKFVSGTKGIKPYLYVAVHDPLGWYRKTWKLNEGGWELEEIGEYKESRDECLIDVKSKKYCIYEYLNKD